MGISNAKSEAHLTLRIPQDLREVYVMIAKHRNISLNTMIVGELRERLKFLVIGGELPAAIEASVAIPSNIVTARMLAQLESVQKIEDAVAEIRQIGECGLCPTYEIFDSVCKMLNAEIREAITRDTMKNGPLMYYPPDDPRCKKPGPKLALGATIVADGPVRIIEDQNITGDIKHTGALLDESDADEVLRGDLNDAMNAGLDK